MKKYLLPALLIFLSMHSMAQGSFVFGGAEAVNTGIIDLATPAGSSWATDRSSSPGYFSILTGASFSGVSNTTNVDGYVKKYGNEAFTFPVGNGSELRSLSISAPSNAGDAFATAWVAGDPNGNNDPTAPNSGAHSRASLGVNIVSVSPVGQWDWQDFNNDGAGLTITVSMPDMSAFALTNNLRLVGWNGGIWQDLSGAATASGNTAGSTLSGTMVNGVTAIGIASTTWILNTNLVSATVVARDCNALLSWTTENENGNAYFDIEQSTNGSSFIKMGSLPATHAQNSGNYHFTAAQNNGILYYYRIKIANADGSFFYSPVYKLLTNCGSPGNYMSLYPNPVVSGSGQVSLRFKVDYKGKAMALVTNNLGQRFTSQPITITDGENLFTFNTGAMAVGTYYVRLTDNNGNTISEIKKLIKK